jgi:hypothetical protein
MKRRSLRLLSWMLVGTLLYAQMAVAAYACPRLAAAASDVSMVSMAMTVDTNGDKTVAPASAMSGDCAGMQGAMDPSAPKLCADHCNYGHQTDQTPNLTVPTALFTPLYVAQPMRLPSVPSQPAADLSALAEASPPLAILHCCFRI